MLFLILYFQIMLAISQDKEEKCREVLSCLLNQQIQRNQQLQTENLELEEQQRRLLELLQIKMQQIQKLQEKPNRNNDSTLEMTQFGIKQPKQMSEWLKQSKQFKCKINSLEKMVGQKESEMVRLRNYYTDVIQRLEEQYKNKNDQENSITQNVISKLKQQLKKVKQQNQSFHELIMKGSDKIRQLSQELIMVEQLNKDMGLIQKVADDRKEKLVKIEKQLLDLQKENEQRLMDLKFEYQEREMKKIKQVEDKIVKLRRESEQKNNKLKRQLQQKLQQTKLSYDERINFMIVRSEEQKQEIKHKYIQQAKAILLSQLQKQQQENKDKITMLQTGMRESQQKLKSTCLRNQEQSKVIINLQREIQSAFKNIAKTEDQLKKYHQQCQQRNEKIKKLQQKCNTQKQNEEYLETLNKKLSEQLNQLSEKYTKILNENKRIEQLHKKISTQFGQIKQKHQSLEEQFKNNVIQLEIKTGEVERLSAKISKELERKEKILLERKKIIDEQIEQIQLLKSRLDHVENGIDQKEKLHEQKLKEQKDLLNKHLQQKNKVIKENKKIKEEVVKLEERVKGNFAEYEKRIDDLTLQNKQFYDNNKNLLAEKQNYRKIYETNTNELTKCKQRLSKSEQKNERLILQLNNYQQEIELLKEQITSNQLQENERQQVQKYKEQCIELKAKLANSNDVIAKIKRENAQLARDTINLHTDKQKLEESLKKHENKYILFKNEKHKLEKQVNQLKFQLDKRCQKIQTDMPYINTLIDEKKIIETQLQKCKIEMQRKDHLIDLAKRSKAEEWIKLQNQCENLKRQQQRLKKDIEDQKLIIEQMNRNKVNTYRQETTKQDLIRKLEKDVKHLKSELKKSQKTCDEQQAQIQNLFNMLSSLQQNQKHDLH